MEKMVVLITGAFLSLFSLQGQDANIGYKIVQKITLGGEGGWDYLNADDASGMLYVSHGNMVHVVDLTSGKNVAAITDVNGVHGIAIAKEFSKGYISNGASNNVTVFNTSDFSILGRIDITGKNPDAIIYEPFTRSVITFNGRTSNATVIDVRSGKVSQTISLDGKPEYAVSDGKGKVYVNIEDKSEVSVINVKTWKVEQTWSIGPGKDPTGLALDVDNQRLFCATSKLMVILDAETGKVITTVPTGDRVDGAAFDPRLKRVYISCGEGLLTVIQEETPDSFKVLENVKTQAGARTISLSEKTHRIYLPTAEIGPARGKTTNNSNFTVLVIEPGK